MVRLRFPASEMLVICCWNGSPEPQSTNTNMKICPKKGKIFERAWLQWMVALSTSADFIGIKRFPKSWGVPAGNPKSSKSLDNFSIETHGFGDPPV